MPDPRLKTYASQAIRHLGAAGDSLAGRQSSKAPTRGNVAPWQGEEDADLHGTLAAIWVWARHQLLSADPRFAGQRAAAWSFVETAWKRFIPDAIGSAASDEAAYDCALALVAHVAERAVGPVDGRRQGLIDGAARLLSTCLADLEQVGGRDFRDPGFLAWALLQYGRAVEDRGLVASGRRFVERAFGMKAPAPWAEEPSSPADGLFDFASTTATRILAVIASEGNTPFVGAWLRERVAPLAPPAFVPRRLDENTWNACAAWALGRAYVVSTDPVFMVAYSTIMDELERRDEDRDGALGRDRTFRSPDTLTTFYYALAVDALVTGELPAGGAQRTPEVRADMTPAPRARSGR
ncbi:MAG TPA: hypothetical protein VMU50_17610 [Polyangia bacterium]|nr:hypothetical protein [Polyangia bacterium]